MLTSKERAELRAQANGLETTLIVGKGGVTEQVVLEAVTQLEARELIKGRALEASFLTAREALDALCAATGAEPVCAVGFRFVLYRESERLKRERNQVGRAKLAPVPVAKSNPGRRQGPPACLPGGRPRSSHTGPRPEPAGGGRGGTRAWTRPEYPPEASHPGARRSSIGNRRRCFRGRSAQPRRQTGGRPPGRNPPAAAPVLQGAGWI